MATILFTLSTGEVMPSTDPHGTPTESVEDTLTMVAQTLCVAVDEGMRFMVFPDDRTGRDRVLSLAQIVAVDVKVESASVAAVRASEDVSAAQSGVTADVFPLR